MLDVSSKTTSCSYLVSRDSRTEVMMSSVAETRIRILARSMGRIDFSCISLIMLWACFFAMSFPLLVPAPLMFSLRSSMAFRIIVIGNGICVSLLTHILQILLAISNQSYDMSPSHSSSEIYKVPLFRISMMTSSFFLSSK